MGTTKILFMGRKPVAAKCLEHILQRSDVTVCGVLTDSHLEISPTSDIARQHNIPLYTFESALEKMNAGSLTFDLGISVLYWRKLRDAFLTIPPLGVINFHPAPLPQYKGTAGYNMAILDGLDFWASTAHYIDAGIDTGAIIDVSKFPICPETETAKSLEATSQDVIYKQFLAVVDNALQADKKLPTTSNVGGVYISRKEMEAMKEIKPGDDINRKIRAFWFPPYHGAFIMLNGEKYTLVNPFILESLADKNNSSLFTEKSKGR